MKKVLAICALIAFSTTTHAISQEQYEIMLTGAKECFAMEVVTKEGYKTTLGEYYLVDYFAGEPSGLNLAPGANQVYSIKFDWCRKEYFEFIPGLNRYLVKSKFK